MDDIFLTFWSRVKLRLFGRTYTRHRIRSGWRLPGLPFYAFKCPNHGIVENYPQSHRGHLYCPECGRIIHSGVSS